MKNYVKASFNGRSFLLETPEPASAQVVARWCDLYALPKLPFMYHCSKLQMNDQVPRGSEKHIRHTRKLLLEKIRGVGTMDNRYEN